MFLKDRWSGLLSAPLMIFCSFCSARGCLRLQQAGHGVFRGPLFMIYSAAMDFTVEYAEFAAVLEAIALTL